ncbi:nucleotide exchange factor GrpE [Streptomyces sp. NPDC003038]|uniref:nucleotide exchange factor GrpE n=1 Tax=unclassified Streptomyces TaxID=2593676 RepID=UPI0033A7FF35
MSEPNRSGPRKQPPAPVVIRDRRRIDPETLQLREADPAQAGGHRSTGRDEDLAGLARSADVNGSAGRTAEGGRTAEAGRTAEVERQLAERTADLQRLKADYDNYRKRVQRDRLAIREIAVANVLGALLPVLDATDRAREHGELTGGLRAITDVLETQLATLGLETVGTPGEPFDPTRHEAISYERSDAVDRPTCTAVLRRGYAVGEHLLRPAQVAVSEPPDPEPSGLEPSPRQGPRAADS